MDNHIIPDEQKLHGALKDGDNPGLDGGSSRDDQYLPTVERFDEMLVFL